MFPQLNSLCSTRCTKANEKFDEKVSDEPVNLRQPRKNQTAKKLLLYLFTQHNLLRV